MKATGKSAILVFMAHMFSIFCVFSYVLYDEIKIMTLNFHRLIILSQFID